MEEHLVIKEILQSTAIVLSKNLKSPICDAYEYYQQKNKEMDEE
jgi:hypothetical protein